MTSRDIARARMVGSTLAVCDAHVAAWQGMPAFATALEEMRGKYGRLAAMVSSLLELPTNPTAEKKERRRVMVTRTLGVLNTLEVLSLDRGEAALQEAVKTERGRLWNAPAEAATAECRRLLGIARQHQEALAAYMLGGERLDGLEESIAAHEALIALPLATVRERKERNQEIHDLLHEVVQILHQRLDKLVFVLRERAPEFAAAYAQARVIGNALRDGQALPEGVAS